MNNILSLRTLVAGSLIEEEANEFLNAIQEELDELEQDNKYLKKELSDKEDELDELQESYDRLINKDETENFEAHVIAGLDTIYIKLDQENMEIRNRVDTFLSQLKRHHNASNI